MDIHFNRVCSISLRGVQIAVCFTVLAILPAVAGLTAQIHPPADKDLCAGGLTGTWKQGYAFVAQVWAGFLLGKVFPGPSSMPSRVRLHGAPFLSCPATESIPS